jgi:hypothetical protein
MDDMLPSEVRRRVLEDHARLREGITKLREVADTADLDALRASARAFFAQLETHMAMEDHELAGVLRTIDAWGPERAARLARDHAAQRVWIRSYDAFIGKCTSHRLARDRILTFLAELEDDMTREEARDLNEDLLADGGPAPDLGSHID